MEKTCFYCHIPFHGYSKQRFCTTTCSNRFNQNNKKPCKIPSRYSAPLAEFVGIVMGDGGITAYQCTITVNAVDDNDYSFYIERLTRRLFGISVGRSRRKETKALALTISRKSIVNFLIQLGMKKGHKINQNLDIPAWIMNNATYQKACLRGLFDTDGCIFSEVHVLNNKRYSYPRLNFTTASLSLAKSILVILVSLGLHPVLRRNGKAVQLEKKEEICQYFNTIGTSNIKHASRWEKFSK